MRRHGYRKYKAVKTEIDGHKFDSMIEARRYAMLIDMLEAGQIRDLKMQVPYVLIPTIRYPDGKLYKQVTKYIADFEYIDCNTNELVTEDVKGMRTAVYQIKKALFFQVTGRYIREINKEDMKR